MKTHIRDLFAGALGILYLASGLVETLSGMFQGIAELTAPFLVPADIIGSAVAGTGDTAATLAIEIVVSLFVLGYAYYAALIAGFSLSSIWFAEVIGWVVCLVLSWLWLQSNYWKRLTI